MYHYLCITVLFSYSAFQLQVCSNKLSSVLSVQCLLHSLLFLVIVTYLYWAVNRMANNCLWNYLH